jgi:hypothetical protein
MSGNPKVVVQDYGTNCKDCQRYQKLGDICMIEHGKKFQWEYCGDFEPVVVLPDYKELMRSVRADHVLERKRLKEKKEKEKRKKQREREEKKELKRKKRRATLRKRRERLKKKELKAEKKAKKLIAAESSVVVAKKDTNRRRHKPDQSAKEMDPGKPNSSKSSGPSDEGSL